MVNTSNAATYHYNYVTINAANNKVALAENGTFEIQWRVISGGQNPPNENNIGDVKTFALNKNDLCFYVGRNKSEYVWDGCTPYVWNNTVVTTYNIENTGKMNFAFAGRMTLKTEDGKNIYLDDVIIGQFDANTSNTWLMGGSRCTMKTFRTVVECISTPNEQGEVYSVQFVANNINTFTIQNTTLITTK